MENILLEDNLKNKRKPPLPGRDSLARREIVKRMQERHLESLGLSNKVITEVLNAFIEVYKEAILESQRVEIRNFGVLESKLVKGRLITHPETNEEVPASPYYRIAFKPSAAFRDSLRQKAKQEVQKL